MMETNALDNPVLLLARSAVRRAPVGIAAWARTVLRHAAAPAARSSRFVLVDARGERLGTVRDARPEIRFGRSEPAVLLRRGG